MATPKQLEIRARLMSIIGYTCETAAPNAEPTTEYILDRWMQPRLEALIEYVEREREQALVEPHECEGQRQLAALAREVIQHPAPDVVSEIRRKAAGEALIELAGDLDAGGYGWPSSREAERLRERIAARGRRLLEGGS